MMEAIVDAYALEQQTMGWYNYLQDKSTFPFKARCFRKYSISPLRKCDEIIEDGKMSEIVCAQEVFAKTWWMERPLSLTVSQLEAQNADEETIEVIGEWHYRVDRGYGFG